MNKQRRKRIWEQAGRMEDMISNEEYPMETIVDIYEELDLIKDEEESYYDNIPENLKYSQRAESSEEAIDLLDDAMTAIDYIEENDTDEYKSQQLNEAIDCLNGI